MEFKILIDKAHEVKNKYQMINKKKWGATEYAQGLIGDAGDLMKLIMAKNGFREIDNVDKKITHELSDCLWSIFMIADELGIDLDKEFIKNMDELNERIARDGK